MARTTAKKAAVAQKRAAARPAARKTAAKKIVPQFRETPIWDNMVSEFGNPLPS